MIRVRPHHFLCTLGFQGKGYSPAFVQNFWAISQRLREPNGDQQTMQVVADADDICLACPKRRGRVCVDEDSIRQLDSKHAEVLGLQDGDVLTWGQARQLLKERMTLEQFHLVCANCKWKSLGYCEAALRDVQALPKNN